MGKLIPSCTAFCSAPIIGPREYDGGTFPNGCPVTTTVYTCRPPRAPVDRREPADGHRAASPPPRLSAAAPLAPRASRPPRLSAAAPLGRRASRPPRLSAAAPLRHRVTPPPRITAAASLRRRASRHRVSPPPQRSADAPLR